MTRWVAAARAKLRLPQLLPPPPAAPVESVSRPSILARSLDFVSDLGVLAFAVWTLIAYVGMATQAKATLLVAIWLATVPILGAILVALARRPQGATASEPTHQSQPGVARTQATTRLGLACLAAGLVAAIFAATVANAVWPLVWAGAVAAVAVPLVRGGLRSEGSSAPGPAPAWPAHVFAALVGLGFGAMSLFLNRPNGDDTFYVNRAVGTAQLNRIPVRDIIFTDERIGPISGAGLPVDSFSALEGAVGRFVGIHGASVAYYVVPPLMTFFATWALWRLVRAWAPRSVVLCFALGCVYWIFSAQSALTAGSYFLNRMWQGKVILVAWLVPTAYVLLTRWLAGRDSRTAVLLLAVGVSGIGMTASATFVVPLLFGTAMLTLVARRDWRGFPVLLAASAFPFLVGFIATQMYSVKLLGDRELSNAWYFHEIFGAGALGAVSLIALWAAPWLARRGPAARLTTAIALVALLLLTPALLPALNELTHLTSILRRTLWIVPLPALVGLLGAVPVAAVLRRVPDARSLQRRIATAAPAVVVAALLVGLGHPLWISWRKDEPLWVAQPAWKVHERPLRKAWAILRHYDEPDPILAEEPIMHAIGIITIRPKGVNARGFYALLAPEPRQRTRDRLALTRWVTGEEPTPPRERIERALIELRVRLVCVDARKPLIAREVEGLGYREAFEARNVVCLERPP
jgi:uncharacterized protein DUF6077